MSVELKLTGRCVGCPGLDIELSRLFANGRTCEIIAHCRNLELCQRIEQHILENPYRGPDLLELEI